MERPSGPPRLRKSDFFDFPENELKLKIPQGHYECQVENSFGSASSIIRLTDKGMICSSEFFLASFFILSIFSEPANLLVTSLAPGPVWKTRQESLYHAIWRDHLVSYFLGLLFLIL